MNEEVYNKLNILIEETHDLQELLHIEHYVCLLFKIHLQRNKLEQENVPF